MKNILFLIVCLFLNCSRKCEDQKDPSLQSKNSQKKSAAYIIDIYKESRENKPKIYPIKDLFFERDSVYKILKKKKIELQRSFSKKTESHIYPTYYGGSYVNKKDNRLYINVVDSLNNQVTQCDIIKRIGSGYFSIKPCSYSLNMLTDTLQALETIFNKKKKTLPQSLIMSRFEIYEQNNTILVLLEDSTADVVSAFKKYLMDSPMIQFAQQPIPYLQ